MSIDFSSESRITGTVRRAKLQCVFVSQRLAYSVYTVIKGCDQVENLVYPIIEIIRLNANLLSETMRLLIVRNCASINAVSASRTSVWVKVSCGIWILVNAIKCGSSSSAMLVGLDSGSISDALAE